MRSFELERPKSLAECLDVKHSRVLIDMEREGHPNFTLIS